MQFYFVRLWKGAVYKSLRPTLRNICQDGVHAIFWSKMPQKSKDSRQEWRAPRATDAAATWWQRENETEEEKVKKKEQVSYIS